MRTQGNSMELTINQEAGDEVEREGKTCRDVNWSKTSCEILFTTNMKQLFLFTTNIEQLFLFTTNIEQLFLFTTNIEQLFLFTTNIEQLFLFTTNIETIILVHNKH